MEVPSRFLVDGQFSSIVEVGDDRTCRVFVSNVPIVRCIVLLLRGTHVL